MYPQTHMHVCVYVYLYIYIYMYLSIFVLCISIYIYICMYICVYTYFFIWPCEGLHSGARPLDAALSRFQVCQPHGPGMGTRAARLSEGGPWRQRAPYGFIKEM